MTAAFIIIASATLVSAAIAMSLRNLIHSALLLVISWAGIAAFYLWAGAEFVAFAQVLVYIGAVSMVVLFAILLTRQSQQDATAAPSSVKRAAAGLIAGAAVFAVLLFATLRTPLSTAPAARPADLTVNAIGTQLMGPDAAALLVVGVLLTVALLGAIVIASLDRPNAADSEL